MNCPVCQQLTRYVALRHIQGEFCKYCNLVWLRDKSCQRLRLDGAVAAPGKEQQ